MSYKRQTTFPSDRPHAGGTPGTPTGRTASGFESSVSSIVPMRRHTNNSTVEQPQQRTPTPTARHGHHHPHEARPTNVAPSKPSPQTLQDVSQPIDTNDPLTLKVVLSKHRENLGVTLKEVNALKAVIKGLEGTINQLQSEKTALLDQLKASKAVQEDYIEQIQQLTEMCENLTATIQRSGVENAARISRMESKWRQQEAKYHSQIERLTSQLLSTQHPTNTARPIPWSKIASIEGHPAHVLREVVLDDQKREERILNNTVLGEDATDHLDALVSQSSATSKGGKFSEDEVVWRQVLARIHLVLKQRRKLISVESNGGLEETSPVDFLLRTRHQLVAEAAHLHEEVQKCSALLMGIIHKLEATSSVAGMNKGFAAMEGQLELVCTFIGDMDFSLNRIKVQCFTDVDKAMHDVNPKDLIPV